MEKNDKDPVESLWRRFFRHSAPLGLFVVLPLLIAGYLGYQTIANERAKHIDRVSGELDKNLIQGQYEAAAGTFLRKIGRGAWHKLRQRKADRTAFDKYCSALQRFLPVEFDMYAFDESGALVTPSSIPLRSRYIASRLWELLRGTPTEQNRLFLKIKKQLKAFVGEEFRVSKLIEGRDSSLPIMARHRSGMIYWTNDPENPAHGILLVFWEIPSTDFRLSQVGKRNLGHLEAGFFSRTEDEIKPFGHRRLASKEAGSIYRRVVLLGQSAVFDESEMIWAGRKIEGYWLFAAAKTAAASFGHLQVQMHVGLILLAILAFVLYFWSIQHGRFYLSLRIKLLALFFMAVMMPIMGFAYLGYRYLDDREQTLLATVANHSRQLLFSMDESFKNAGANFIDDFSDLSSRLAAGADDSLKADILAKIEANELISIELRDASKAEMLFFQQNELFFEGMREVSDAFSRYCIDNALGTSLADAVDPILDMVIRSPEAGLNFFFVRPHEVHKMDFGPIPLFIFWELSGAGSEKPLYIYIVQSASRLLKQLVGQRMVEVSHSRATAPYILAANYNQTESWLPARLKSGSKMKNFVSLTQFSNKPIDTRVRIGGEEYLVTGQQGRFVKDYCLFAFYPLSLVEHDIARQSRFIRAGIFLFLLLALTAGWLLSDVFLLPIARLGEGVNAIKAHDPDFRIVVYQKDEFGDLALNFNQMIADLKEMQLAKDVQESLLPSEPPQLKGYQISFANRMALAVGGDYFDVRVLDRDRVCVVIGDVTGHGVGSALVMAMAKALVYQGLKEDCGLVEIFEDLNSAIYTYFHVPPVRKMITVFAAIIEMSTGRGSFINAGHNFPIKVAGDGSCEDLQDIHLPVGAFFRLRGMEIHEFSIESGECVVFYTDGLIEVTNSQDEMYGYDRLKESLAQHQAPSAELVAKALVSEYDAWLGNAEPDDDLTIVVLKRDSAAGAV
ncbi:MAG: SpoIIE family protein phosphatase [Candidatus Riflebacteria bacterium]|nr:SpoIIE family protein phosphatase [Candidatus Riflebacteria bacterium]